MDQKRPSTEKKLEYAIQHLSDFSDMPLKPTKRGIKLWLRYDAGSGYIYGMNIYCGKETNPQKNKEPLTLGERVVKLLASTIKNVVLCFENFFTSVHLLETLNFPALGTCIFNRKNMPTSIYT